jgi:hypothetical protein
LAQWETVQRRSIKGRYAPRLLLIFYAAGGRGSSNSYWFHLFVKERQALAMNGHDCHQFESPFSEKVIQIAVFGNR